MRDPYNPMRSEIREWAFTKDAVEPAQDWDLHLARIGEFDLYVQLAGDGDCPNRDYFVRLLYFVVGDAVRANYRTLDRTSVESLLKLTEPIPRFTFHRFRQRATALMANPSSFDYDEWCAGGLAAADLASAGKE